MTADPRLASLLRALHGNAPTDAEEKALKAVARGRASEGQQKIAFRYILSLGGAGDLMFDAQSERMTAFRLGSQALVQALAHIAGASWLSFRAEPDEH